MTLQSASPPNGTTLRRVDLLDTDLLSALEVMDKRLYALISEATRYRRVLREQLVRLRGGDDPAKARAELERWRPCFRRIKRLAREA